MIEYDGYRVAEPHGLETPSMLVYETIVDHNITAASDLGGGGEHLMPHVKTHKSAAVTRKQLQAGIAGFKCATLQELEMVLDVGASSAILSYPQLQESKVERFCDLSAAYESAQVYTIVSHEHHVEALAMVANRRERPVLVMLDLDAGMHRTGVAPEEAETLYAEVAARRFLEPAGLHLYDGHEHLSDDSARAAAAQRHIDGTRELVRRLEATGMRAECLVGGGTFSFPYYAKAEGFLGSPGTAVYWDYNYGTALEQMPFRWAALILTQVVDIHIGTGSVTTDLGIKAVCGDPILECRARLLGHQQARLVLQNEEHGVFRWPGDLPEVGTYLLAVPGHVCSTTIRYPGSFVLDDEGQVVDYYPHTARDRQ